MAYDMQGNWVDTAKQIDTYNQDMRHWTKDVQPNIAGAGAMSAGGAMGQASGDAGSGPGYEASTDPAVQAAWSATFANDPGVGYGNLDTTQKDPRNQVLSSQYLDAVKAQNIDPKDYPDKQSYLQALARNGAIKMENPDHPELGGIRDLSQVNIGQGGQIETTGSNIAPYTVKDHAFTEFISMAALAVPAIFVGPEVFGALSTTGAVTEAGLATEIGTTAAEQTFLDSAALSAGASSTAAGEEAGLLASQGTAAAGTAAAGTAAGAGAGTTTFTAAQEAILNGEAIDAAGASTAAAGSGAGQTAATMTAKAVALQAGNPTLYSTITSALGLPAGAASTLQAIGQVASLVGTGMSMLNAVGATKSAANTLSNAATQSGTVLSNAAINASNILAGNATKVGGQQSATALQNAKDLTAAYQAAGYSYADAQKLAGQQLAAAAEKSAGQTVAGYEQAIGTQDRTLAQQIRAQQPFYQAGVDALGKYQALTTGPGNTFTMADAVNSPAEQYAQQQAAQALQNQQAASGGQISSNAISAGLTQAGQIASTYEQQAFNQWLSQKKLTAEELQNLIVTGQTSLSAINADLQSHGVNVSNLQGLIGNAKATGTTGAAQALAAGDLGAAQTLSSTGQEVANINAAGNTASTNAITGGETGAAQATAGGITGSANATAGGIIGAGNATAAGTVGAANAINTGVSNIASILNQGTGAYRLISPQNTGTPTYIMSDQPAVK